MFYQTKIQSDDEILHKNGKKKKIKEKLSDD